MRDAPRRRRSDEESGGRGLPLFPLIVVVVLAGLLLGGVLAHFFGGTKGAPGPASTMVAGNAPQEPTPAPISPPPSAAPEASATSVPSSTAPPTIAASPSPKATPATTPRPTTAVTQKPKTTALATSAPTHKPAVAATQKVVAVATVPPATAPPATASPVPAHTAPPAPARTAPPSGNTHAASVVRSYLEALARGDRGTASTYLAHGYPTESFINSEARIESISSANIGGQQYRVGADVQTSSGEYFITFTLQQSAGTMLITDHSAIKPQ